MKTFDLDREISRNQTVVVDSAYEFRNVVPWERAISLVVTNEASILIPRADGTLVRSTYLTVERPLVVALNRYVGRPMRTMEKDSPATKSMILVRDNWTCVYCGEYGDTIDHIQPKSRKGGNTWGNLCVACFSCNGLKGDMTPEEMGWKSPVIPKTMVSRRKEAIQSAIYHRLEEMATS